MKKSLKYILFGVFGVALLSECYGDRSLYSGTLHIKNNTAYTLTFPNGINVWNVQEHTGTCSLALSGKGWTCSLNAKAEPIAPYSSGSIDYEASGWGETKNCYYGQDTNYCFQVQLMDQGSKVGEVFEAQVNKQTSDAFNNWVDPTRKMDESAKYNETVRIMWPQQSSSSVLFYQTVVKLRGGTANNQFVEQLRKEGKLDMMN